jgi:hypothetical protein
MLLVRFANKPAHQFDPLAGAVTWIVTAELCHGAADLQTTDPEMGAIDGLKFAKTTFRYTDPRDGIKKQGTAYAHLEGPVLCEAVIVATDPGEKQFDSIANASLLSLRKKK